MRKLSICIPTYNRYEFLVWTLERLKRDLPDAPIIVSDNASGDFTRFDKGYLVTPHRCIHQEMNIGAFPNMRAALLEATSEYAVYCGDDDYLLPGPLNRGIRYLDEHPDVVAYFAPCMLYDEIAGKDVWPAYKFKSAHTFRKDSPGELFNFLIQQHVWPEHAIYRVSALKAIMEARIRPYWAFVDLANALQAGNVYFSPDTFYRNITAHPIGERTKLGDQQCLTDFEEYRSGLELLALSLFGMEFPDEARAKIHNMINFFMFLRFEVAHRLLRGQGRNDEAQIMWKRMQITKPTGLEIKDAAA